MNSVHPVFGTSLPSGWTLRCVDEVKSPEKSSCVAGPFGSNISSKYFTLEGVPVIRGSNLTDDLTKFVSDDFVFVSPERAVSYPAQHVRAGDLVFTCWGTIGQVGLVPDDGPYPEYIISNKQLKLRPNTSICDPRFLFYYFASPAMVEHIRNRAIGSAVPGINLGILKALPVVLPPLPTQRKITAVLSAYDDLIENNNRRIRLLEEMAQRIYREWFVDFRYPGHENVPLVDSDLGQIPQGWDVSPLTNVCDRITDGAHLSPATTSVGKPMASVKDMTPRRLDLRTCRRIGDAGFDALVRQDCRPRINDILIAKDGSYLKHVFVVRCAEDVVILSSIALLRPSEAIQPDILALSLQQTETRERLKGFVSGVAIPRIVLKDFRRFPIVNPPTEIQQTFVEIIAPALRQAFELDNANAKLRSSRDLLIPRLISGDVDVTELNIVIAEDAA